MTTAPAEICEVRILGLPLALQRAAQEQHDELMREFALLDIADSAPGRAAVPRRLRDLIDTLVLRYSSVGEAPDAEREAARSRGEAAVDLVYTTPTAVGPACEALLALLDEADEFCRAGGQLLTLAAPSQLVAYRHWYLGEFTRQCSGGQPTSWAAYAGSHPVVPPKQSAPRAM